MTDVFADVAQLGRITEAAGMRIANVEPVLLSYLYPASGVQAWSGGVLPGVTAVFARVTTEDGLDGIGETYAGNFVPEAAAALISSFASYLIGMDPSDITGIRDLCFSRTRYWGRGGLAVASFSAVESALWDLCGKALGKPVVDLLGGIAAQDVRSYASGGMEGDAESLSAEIQDDLEQGFRSVKIRTGVSPAADREKAAVARAALGDGELAVDAVQGSNPSPWTADQAIACGRDLADLNLIWFEEPCAAEDIDGYVACRRALDMPIAGGESVTTAAALRPYLSAGAFDIVQPDASFIGGILEARAAGALAGNYGTQVAMHAWGSGPCVMANIHAGLATASCRWLEIPANGNPLISDLLAEPLVVEDGKLRPPRSPGLGVRLTPEVAARYPYRPGAHYHMSERRDVPA